MNCFEKYRDQNRVRWYYKDEVWQGGERLEAFQELYDLDNLWEGEHYQLLIFFFGEEVAPFVKKAWEQMPEFMYQTGYNRRSFRRPNHKVNNYERQINFIINLINYDTNHPFSIKEAISYDNCLNNYYSKVEYVWAAALDTGNKERQNTKQHPSET